VCSLPPHSPIDLPILKPSAETLTSDDDVSSGSGTGSSSSQSCTIRAFERFSSDSRQQALVASLAHGVVTAQSFVLMKNYIFWQAVALAVRQNATDGAACKPLDGIRRKN